MHFLVHDELTSPDYYILYYISLIFFCGFYALPTEEKPTKNPSPTVHNIINYKDYHI